MKQKTVRFYDNVPDDMSALQILDECRKYGFNSARELVITAINRYVRGRNAGSFGICTKDDIDELAEKIATRVVRNVTVNTGIGLMGDGKKINDIDKDENYQKALGFMETL